MSLFLHVDQQKTSGKKNGLMALGAIGYHLLEPFFEANRHGVAHLFADDFAQIRFDR